MYRRSTLLGRLGPHSIGPTGKTWGEHSMFTKRTLSRSLAIVATLATYAFLTQSAVARGGGHGAVSRRLTESLGPLGGKGRVPGAHEPQREAPARRPAPQSYNDEEESDAPVKEASAWPAT